MVRFFGFCAFALASLLPLLVIAADESPEILARKLVSPNRAERLQAAEKLYASTTLPKECAEEVVEFTRLEYSHVLTGAVEIPDKLPAVIKPGAVTRLSQIKANPADYLGKSFTVCGRIEVSDSWYGTYSSEHFYSLTFFELDKDGTDIDVSNLVHFYLPRKYGRNMVDAVQKTESNKTSFVRIAGTLSKANYKEPEDWDQLEVEDIQFLDKKGGWQPPYLSGLKLSGDLLGMAAKSNPDAMLPLVIAPKGGELDETLRKVAATNILALDLKTRKPLATKVMQAAAKVKDKEFAAAMRAFAMQLQAIKPK
jgi:hypothetical protein